MPKSNAAGVVQFNGGAATPDAAGTANRTPTAMSPARADQYKERRKVRGTLCVRRSAINPAVCLEAVAAVVGAEVDDLPIAF